jgi:hypothetical protein
MASPLRHRPPASRNRPDGQPWGARPSRPLAAWQFALLLVSVLALMLLVGAVMPGGWSW